MTVSKDLEGRLCNSVLNEQKDLFCKKNKPVENHKAAFPIDKGKNKLHNSAICKDFHFSVTYKICIQNPKWFLIVDLQEYLSWHVGKRMNEQFEEEGKKKLETRVFSLLTSVFNDFEDCIYMHTSLITDVVCNHLLHLVPIAKMFLVSRKLSFI